MGVLFKREQVRNDGRVAYHLRLRPAPVLVGAASLALGALGFAFALWRVIGAGRG